MDNEGRIVVALERIAAANEDLNSLAREERDSIAQEERDLRESVPVIPRCPHCGAVNPTVRSEGARGDMADIIMIAACEACGKMILGVPAGGMAFFATEGEAVAYRDRGADNGNDS